MARFDYFVVFAEMRTGSNHLEQSLSAIPGITMYGEAFNPGFAGGPQRDDLLGYTLEAREADPLALLRDMLAAADGLAGFRFFHNHDPLVLHHVLADPRCAKIILTRNPLDTYISQKIATITGQWRLRNQKQGKTALVAFDGAEFEAHLHSHRSFQRRLLRALQESGQSAFYLRYEDIGALEVINGIAAFLGIEGRLDALPGKIKRQNPGAAVEKVTNQNEMALHLAGLDPFALADTPNFEPTRGPMVPDILVATDAPLAFLPMPGGPTQAVTDWMQRLCGAPPIAGLNQSTLKTWLKDNTPHHAFTVVRHPLVRAHHAFCHFILPPEPDRFAGFRRKALRQYKVEIPENGPDDTYDLAAHRTGFLSFLGFLRTVLEGQTSLNLPGPFASQLAVIHGMSQMLPPRHILPEAELEQETIALARRIGRDPAPFLPPESDTPFALSEVTDPEIEAAAFAVYRRDYLAFGFARDVYAA